MLTPREFIHEFTYHDSPTFHLNDAHHMLLLSHDSSTFHLNDTHTKCIIIMTPKFHLNGTPHVIISRTPHLSSLLFSVSPFNFQVFHIKSAFSLPVLKSPETLIALGHHKVGRFYVVCRLLLSSTSFVQFAACGLAK